MTLRPHTVRAAFAGLLAASALCVAGGAAPALALTPAVDDHPAATAVNAEVKTNAIVHSAPKESAALPFGVGAGTKLTVECWVQGDASYFKISGGQPMYVKTIHVKVEGDKSRLRSC